MSDGCQTPTTWIPLGEERLGGSDYGFRPRCFLGQDSQLGCRMELRTYLLSNHSYQSEIHPAQVGVVERGDPEPVLVTIVVLGHLVAHFRFTRTADHEYRLVVHGHFLHCQGSLAPDRTHQNIHLVNSDRSLRRTGSVGRTHQLVGVNFDQLDLVLVSSHLDAARFVDLVFRQCRSHPVMLAHLELHRADDTNLDHFALSPSTPHRPQYQRNHHQDC